jgi:uncharacterized membrane protein YqjE
MVEHLKHSVLPRVLADVVGDLADLVQKEMRLAKTELSEKLSNKLRAGLWMGIAGGLGLVAFLLVIEGIVFGIATLGIALHWSCLIVAAVLAVAAGAFYAKGAAQAREELTPSRTIHQVKQDIATAKEQLS